MFDKNPAILKCKKSCGKKIPFLRRKYFVKSRRWGWEEGLILLNGRDRSLTTILVSKAGYGAVVMVSL